MTELEINALKAENTQLKENIASLLRQLDAEREASEKLKIKLIVG